MAITPFYLDWKFWSFVIAFLALILSQAPPIHILLRRAKLEMEVYSLMYVTHKVGNPNAHLHLILNNAGGRTVKIKAIALHLRRDSDSEFILPARSYYQSPGDKNAVMLTSFKLKPKEEWGHGVILLNLFSRQNEQYFRQLTANLRNDISEKRRALVDQNTLVAADDANVQPLLVFFQAHFRWFPGEYSLTVKIDTEPANASISKCYRMTLFESDSEELKNHCKDYKHGFGIHIDYSQHTGVLIPITEA